MGFSRQEYWSGLPLPSPNVRASRDQVLCSSGYPLNSRLGHMWSSPEPPSHLWNLRQLSWSRGLGICILISNLHPSVSVQVWETTSPTPTFRDKPKCREKGLCPPRPEAQAWLPLACPLNLLKWTTESYWIHTSLLGKHVAKLIKPACDLIHPAPYKQKTWNFCGRKERPLEALQKNSLHSRLNPQADNLEGAVFGVIRNWPPIQKYWLVSPEVGQLLPAGQIWPTASFWEVLLECIHLRLFIYCLWLLGFCAKRAE